MYHFIGAVTAGPFRRLFRFRSTGEENIPREGGFVLSANHMSNLDPWPLGIPLYPDRQLRFMAKSEMYRPPLKWVLEPAGAFPVRRGMGDEEAMQKAVELARSGEVVAIFPEGTRRNKGRIKKALNKNLRAKPRSGAARVALQAGVPLVPAAIGGTESLMRLGPLRVAYGPPIELDDLKDLELREAAKIATSRLMEAIHKLEETL
ncbi:MAG TPA: lysophospholipid acyltransferase family protein [Gaiellaceae bacterium]|jgi:1-acyl-sn-glycerol-3-phosphate acyltransferase|nr:lysophospholipid acyltransferase family protein [Gaiellaceae bacterium]